MSTGSEKASAAKSSINEGSPEALFRDNIKAFCEKHGFQLSEIFDCDAPQLQIGFGHFPMWFRFDLDPVEKSATCVGVVRTWGLSGDRSDYHDLISLWWAASLRAANVSSARLIDIPHPVVPGELYGRYIFFDRQPSTSFISTETPDYEAIYNLVLSSSFVAWTFSMLYRGLGGDPNIEQCNDGQAWAARVAATHKWSRNHVYELTNERENADWEFYHRINRGVTAFRFPRDIEVFFGPPKASPKELFVEGRNAFLVKTATVQNAIDKKVWE
jgi:hypothetical protein